jgi:hypothetical protein
MRYRIKILIPVLIVIILFIGSFVMQTKYNTVIMNALTGHGAETLFLKQIVILGTSFAFMNLLIGSVVICFVTMIFILIFVLLNRRRMERRAKIKESLTEVYQKLILDAIADKIITKDEFKQFKKICNGHFRKNILIDQIIDVAVVMPINVLTKLRQLYVDLDLLNETERKLYSWQWHKKIKAMKELSHLDIDDYNKTIVKYVNSKNDILRMEAQIAMVRLSDFDQNPFSFLRDLKHDFSLWEQITLHQLMVEADMKVPDFGEWIYSDNITVNMFCMRMIREYKQDWNVEKLTVMLSHAVDKVRNLTIQVVGDLKLVSLTKNLMEKYKEETYANQLEIVKSLGKIADQSSVEFLQNVVDIETDTDLQIEGVKAIYELGETGKVALEKMMNSNYKDYNIIIKHVLDNKIN